MRNLISLITIYLLIGCGTKTPFERGQPKDGETPSPVGETGTGLSEEVYMAKIFPLLEKDCAGCHDNPAPSFDRAQSLAVFQKPSESPILLRPSGTQHEIIWAPGSAEYNLVTEWIMGGPATDAPPTGKELFDKNVLPNLLTSCARCHANPAPDYATAKSKIVAKDAANSLLYKAATGVGHRQVWIPTSDKALNMKAWIDSEI